MPGSLQRGQKLTAMKETLSCDVVIIGSGFSGTLTALCLHQSGLKVCLLEKEQHPRFAIGESSTPIADMILRSISKTYDLPWLRHFSRYGSWQEHYPEITCGLKRGFSYFKHEPHKVFSTTSTHDSELLVAASSSDRQSDTNWLRSEFDAFLVEKLGDYKISYFDQTEITSAKQVQGGEWKIAADRDKKRLEIQAGFLIDATGGSHFLNRFLDIESTTGGFETNSRAVFSHFENVKPWKVYLDENNIPTTDYPYHPDYSALHHLLQEGWVWMLRFNNECTSAGLLLNLNSAKNFPTDPYETWSSVIERYPSLKNVFENAGQAATPGDMLQTGRLQRRLKSITGQGWAALPHTAGFIDPMHSTGIAHTLSGVEKLVTLLVDSLHDKVSLKGNLKAYEQSVLTELKFIDLLVAGSYESLTDFELFSTYTMLYFISAISYEQRRLRGEIPSHFLCANHQDLSEIVTKSYTELKKLTAERSSRDQVLDFKKRMKSMIEPFNSAGLLNPESNNMYRHTAVEF